MASAEGEVNGQLILWNLVEGRKVAALRPHAEGTTSVAFSPDASMMVTVGQDQHRRVQIIVWDVQMLLLEKVANNAAQVISGLAIAKQLSDFHINRICFSPFDSTGLVSCGRENIRFWRIRKGHLPGRPVLLNEYARGFLFHDIAFYSNPGATPKDPRRPCVYVSSNKGLVVKIDCEQENIVCAYQLHAGPITSFIIHSGYAVTGGGVDARLRVWPLDFGDFLLEAQHEGPVTSVQVSRDGKKLSVGTRAGTLGILNVTEQR
jgi:WD repeat-containing protein 90